MHEAPRADAQGQPVPICLYLPGVKYQLDEKGCPVAGSVEHGICIGIWREAFSAWVDETTGQVVYPSQWQPV